MGSSFFVKNKFFCVFISVLFIFTTLLSGCGKSNRAYDSLQYQQYGFQTAPNIPYIQQNNVNTAVKTVKQNQTDNKQINTDVETPSDIVETTKDATVIIKAIRQAETTIDIQLYILSSDELIQTLINAARNKNINIRLMLERNPINPQEPGQPYPVNLVTYDKFKNSGVLDKTMKIKWTYDSLNFVNQKNMVIDNKTAYIIPDNISNSTIKKNNDLIIINSEQKVLSGIKTDFELTWKTPQKNMQMTMNNKKVVKILSIDGGGIRGIIPAMILKDIEQRLKSKNRHKPFHEIFDLIGGTSTGGLLTIGLTVPDNHNKARFTIDQMIDVYEKRGDEIFPYKKLITKLKMGLFKSKYDSKPFENILNELFGNITTRQALTNILVTSYDPENRKPFFFRKSYGDDNLDFYMKDAARSTTAAPIYFKPSRISPVNSNKEYTLIDAGIFVTNPTLYSYLDAKRMYPEAERFVIVSVGTGSTQKPYDYEKMKKWGFVDWIYPYNGLPLLSMIWDGQSESIDKLLNNLPDVEYHRYDLTVNGLDGNMGEIDDARPENIQNLKRFARQIIRENENDLEYLSNIL